MTPADLVPVVLTKAQVPSGSHHYLWLPTMLCDAPDHPRYLQLIHPFQGCENISGSPKSSWKGGGGCVPVRPARPEHKEAELLSGNPRGENHLLWLILGPPSLAYTSAFQPCCSSTNSVREGERKRMNGSRTGGALGSLGTEGSSLGWSGAQSLRATQRAPFVQLLGESRENGWNGWIFSWSPLPKGHHLQEDVWRLYGVKMLCTPTSASILPTRQRWSGQPEAACESFQHLLFALPHSAVKGVALGWQVHLLRYTCNRTDQRASLYSGQSWGCQSMSIL